MPGKSAQDAKLVAAMIHLENICQTLSEGMDYLEQLLRTQIVSALGKVVNADDFANYMEFHCRHLFKAEFAPLCFAYSIRRPLCDPEGIISLEMKGEPIRSFVRHQERAAPMRFALNATSHVTFYGERFVHGVVLTSFEGSTPDRLSLCARARPFSSFILGIGTVIGEGLVDLKHALIVANEEEWNISLLLETIPTAKEFKDAIESLSPEQQRFAKAYRAMQLEGTLFTVVVIQIKPQMERLLGLVDGSLTQEIELSERLMSLFVEYQVPTDLLTFVGPASASAETRVKQVSENAARVEKLFEEEKKQELQELAKQAAAERMRLEGIAQAERARQEQEARRIAAEQRALEEAARREEFERRRAERARQTKEPKRGLFSRLLRRRAKPKNESVDYTGPVSLDLLEVMAYEEFSAMTDQYLRDCNGMVLVYSVTDRSSFYALSEWLDKLERAQDKYLDELAVVIVGNKIDLDYGREVSEAEGYEFACSRGVEFMETSAKLGINATECMTLCASLCVRAPELKLVHHSQSTDIPFH